MNHAAVYDRLIARARGRVLDCYTEKHHVRPRCIGGTEDQDNIVRLTPEEHFVAHQLLVHMYPEHPQLAFALLAMSRNVKGLRPNNKLFGWMRRRMGDVIRAAKTGVPCSPEATEKMRQSKTGQAQTPEHKAAIRKATKGLPKTAEHLAKISASNKGRRSPMEGKRHSAETKAKMRAAATGRKMSAEAVHNMVHNLTPEERSARAHKAWATKRAKATQQQLL